MATTQDKTTSKLKRFFRNNLQQVLMAVVIFVSIMALIYALAFSTNWAGGDEFRDAPFDGVIGLDTITGHWFSQLSFNFNQFIFLFAIIAIFLIIIMLMFGSINRKKYYITNYISTGILGLVLLILAVYMVIRLPILHAHSIEMLNSPAGWNPERVLFPGTVFELVQDNQFDFLALFIGNATLDPANLPVGWRFGAAHHAWYEQFVTLGYMPKDTTPVAILNAVSQTNTMFILGYLVIIGLFASVASIIFVNLRQLKAAKTKSVTYTQVAAAIEAGDVTLIASKKKVDLDDESIVINVSEQKGQLTPALRNYAALKAKLDANKGKLSGDGFAEYRQLKKELAQLNKEIQNQKYAEDQTEKLTALNENAKQVSEKIAAIDAAIVAGKGQLSETEVADIKQQMKVLKAQIAELRVDKMRFQANGLAYGLTFLSIIIIFVAGYMSLTYAYYGQFVAGFVPLIGRVIPTINHAIDILLIILTMLVLFLCAEKLKFYKKGYIWVAFVFVALTVARIFYIPLIDHIRYVETAGDSIRQGLPTTQFVVVILLMAAGAAIQFFAAFITLRKTRQLDKHFELFGEK